MQIKNYELPRRTSLYKEGKRKEEGILPSLSKKELASIINVPHLGYNDYSKGQWPPSIAQEEVTWRVGKDANAMSCLTRVIHRVVSQRVTPRQKKHGMVNFQDYLLIDKILQKERVNLPCQVMHHMGHISSSSKSGLPYPGFIKKVLTHFGIYHPVNEVPAFMKFDIENLVRMGFKFDMVKGWIPKKENPALPGRDEPQPVAHAVDLTPVIDMLGVITENLDKVAAAVGGLSLRVVSIEESIEKMKETMGKVEESADIGLINQMSTKEVLTELQRQLRYYGVTLLDELRILIARKR